MKIAYVLNRFPKLSESFVLNEIVELIKMGHDIQIFSMHLPIEENVHDEANEPYILEKTHYFISNQIDVNPFKLSYYFLKALIQDLCNLKISINGLKLDLKLAYFASIMEEKDVEFIHAHFANMGNVASRLSKLLGLPYTFTAHAFDIYMNADKDKLKKVMDDAKLVITISKFNKNYLRDEIGVSNSIEVIRCGINLNKFNPQRKSNVEGRIRMLTVARLVEKKGIAYLIKAICIVIKEISDCELTIVGTGPRDDYLNRLVRNLDLEGIVKFRGNVSDSELMKCHEDADMFILPCVPGNNGDLDGIPVAIMEAMAMKLPVISTSVSGIPELVEDGVSGLLVPPGDEKAIAEAIVMLSKDMELRARMGKIGRKIIERKFNIMLEAEKLSNSFQEIKVL